MLSACDNFFKVHLKTDHFVLLWRAFRFPKSWWKPPAFWMTWGCPHPVLVFNPYWLVRSLHTGSFLWLLCGCPGVQIKFSFRIVFEDHLLLDLTENTIFILDYCCDFFFKAVFHFLLQLLNLCLKIKRISVFWWGIGLCTCVMWHLFVWQMSFIDS